MNKRIKSLFYLNTAYWLSLALFEGIGFFPGITLKIAGYTGGSQWDSSVVNQYWAYIADKVLPKYLLLWGLGFLIQWLFVWVRTKNRLWVVLGLFSGGLVHAMLSSAILGYYDLNNGVSLGTLIEAQSGLFFFFTMLLNASLSYWLFIVALFAFEYFQRYREEKFINLELRNSLNESKLETLVYQLRPHFLFNAMNSISMLVRSNNNQKANEVITDLSELLRSTLKEEKRQLVPLKEEIEMASKYLDLEEKLYSEHLIIKREIKEDCMNVVVPHLILQPIIENAFKHGISKMTKSCTLTIQARMDEEHLILKVINTGPEVTSENKFGIGLTNVTKRLKNIYGDDFEFNMDNYGADEVYVSIKIPARI